MNGYIKFLIAVFLAFQVCPSFAQQPELKTDRDVESEIVTAVSKYQSKDLDGALALFREIALADPDNDAAYYYIAQIAIQKKDLENAEIFLKKAVELDPSNFWYRYRLAAVYSATARKELTIDIYEKLLKDFPKKSELYFDMIEMYASQGENEKALETIEEINKVFGMTESLAVFRYNLLNVMGRQEDAIKSLEEYNEDYSSPYVLTALADHQLSVYDDSTALVYYNEALNVAPGYAPALLGKAEVLRITRRYDEYFPVVFDFVKDPNTSSAGKADYLNAIIQRSDPNFLRNFMPKLDGIVRTCAAVHPKDSSVLRLAGVYFYSTARNEMAKAFFKEDMETYPQSYTSSANYVEFLMYSGDWEVLSDEGRKAFERFPDETIFLEMASMGDYYLERYDKVLEICDKVLEVAPKDSSIVLRTYSTMGDIYHELGDTKRAYKAYDKALKVNPDYVYVLNNYAYYLSLEGKKLNKAYSMSKKTIEAEPENATYLDTFAWILYLQGKALEAKPFFKQAMLTGGKDSPVILDHYAEVLYALKEYDMAYVYWNMARQKNNGEIPDLEEKIRQRKEAQRK